jgi:hypothetical protein
MITKGLLNTPLVKNAGPTADVLVGKKPEPTPNGVPT